MSKTKKELIDDLKSSVKLDPIVSGAKSQTWLNKKVKTALKGRLSSKPVAGRMYIFEYTPKLNYKQLPLYDRFPLIIALEVSNSRVLGLNLHYLPRKTRAKFFEQVLKSGVSTNIRKNSRININISVPKVLYKSYLPKGITSDLIEIDPTEWSTAVNLPTAQFIDR